jgi:hypothetical protein
LLKFGLDFAVCASGQCDCPSGGQPSINQKHPNTPIIRSGFSSQPKSLQKRINLARFELPLAGQPRGHPLAFLDMLETGGGDTPPNQRPVPGSVQFPAPVKVWKPRSKIPAGVEKSEMRCDRGWWRSHLSCTCARAAPRRFPPPEKQDGSIGWWQSPAGARSSCLLFWRHPQNVSLAVVRSASTALFHHTLFSSR